VPIFFQQQINGTTRLGIWKIEETEDFFLSNVPLQSEVRHPHKRLQHLAGRFLLQFLFPGFPYELIRIADTRKPYLPDEEYHFSISHCGDYAAAIVSSDQRVGIDIEIPSPKVERIKHKFLNKAEVSKFEIRNTKSEDPNSNVLTLLWSAKEAVFKWYGAGNVDFRHHIQLQKTNLVDETIQCFFAKTNERLVIHHHRFDHLVLAWLMSNGHDARA
jgi:phosphopantetheinyl transferase